jgi:hypothetical protein
MLVSTTGD